MSPLKGPLREEGPFLGVVQPCQIQSGVSRVWARFVHPLPWPHAFFFAVYNLVNLTQLLCYMWFLTQSKCQSWLLTNPNVVNSNSAAPLATSKHLSDQIRRPTVWGFYSSCYLVFVTSCSAVQSTFYFWKSSHHWIISRFHSGNCMYSLFCQCTQTLWY